MPSRIYLDWNATTPLRAEARSAMLAASELIGNPSSVHAEGREARRLVEDARALLATSVGALPRNAVFTSTGTEANALALSPGLRGPSGGPVERLLVSAVEHASVLAGGGGGGAGGGGGGGGGGAGGGPRPLLVGARWRAPAAGPPLAAPQQRRAPRSPPRP